MKNITKLLFTFLFISLLLPNLAFASWWNPISWFKVELPPQNVTIVSSSTSSYWWNPISWFNKNNNKTSEIEIDQSTTSTTIIKQSASSIEVNKPINEQIKISPTTKIISNKQETQNNAKVGINTQESNFTTEQIKQLQTQVQIQQQQIQNIQQELSSVDTTPSIDTTSPIVHVAWRGSAEYPMASGLTRLEMGIYDPNPQNDLGNKPFSSYLTKVECYIDDTLFLSIKNDNLNSDATISKTLQDFIFDTTKYPDGKYTLTCKAWDHAGNMGQGMNLIKIGQITNVKVVSRASPEIRGGGNIQNNTVNQKIWRIILDIEPEKEIYLKTLTVKMIGSIPTQGIQNIKLYVSGVEVASATGIDVNGIIMFDLSSNPTTVNPGDIEIRADIMNSALDRSLYISLQQTSDLQIYSLNPLVKISLIFIDAQSSGTWKIID